MIFGELPSHHLLQLPRYNTASVSRCFKTEGNVCETSTFCLLKYSHDNRHEDVCWPKAKLMQDLDNQDIMKVK